MSQHRPSQNAKVPKPSLPHSYDSEYSSFPSSSDYDEDSISFKRSSPASVTNDLTSSFNSFRSLSSFPSIQNDIVFGDQHSSRDYQVDGVNFFLFNCFKNQSSILGDEMGLGKIIQVLFFIEVLHQFYKITGPHLIVSPGSAIPNWQQEINK